MENIRFTLFIVGLLGCQGSHSHMVSSDAGSLEVAASSQDGGLDAGGDAELPDGGTRECSWDSWVFEVADAKEGVGADVALAVSDDGSMHVAYHDMDQVGDLRYAHRTPAGIWTALTADDGGPTRSSPDPTASVGSSPSIVVDDAGSIYITHRDGTASDLELAWRRPGGEFEIRTLDADNDVGAVSSQALALEPAGRLRVCYGVDNFPETAYMRCIEGSAARNVNGFDLPVGPGSAPSIAIDNGGGLLLSYLSGRDVHFGRVEGGMGTDEVVDESGRGWESRVIVGRDGTVYLAYGRRIGDRVVPHLAYRPVGQDAWIHVDIFADQMDAPQLGSASELEFAFSGGIAHLVYLEDESDIPVHVAGPANGPFEWQRIGEQPASSVDVAVDPADGVHVVFQAGPRWSELLYYASSRCE